MAKYTCVDCGLVRKSTLTHHGPRRCRACTTKAKNDHQPVIRKVAAAYGAPLEEVGLRELKANPGDILSRLEESPDTEIIITRYGKPSAK